MDQNSQQPSFLEKFNLPVKSLWEGHKTFLIVFGVILVIIKFQDVIMDVLVSGSKKTVDKAEKKDEQLNSQENTAKTKADAAVKAAEDLDNNKPKVDEDWYKK